MKKLINTVFGDNKKANTSHAAEQNGSSTKNRHIWKIFKKYTNQKKKKKKRQKEIENTKTTL